MRGVGLIGVALSVFVSATSVGEPNLQAQKKRIPFQLNQTSPKGEIVINYREVEDSRNVLPFSIEVRQGGGITHVIDLDQSYHQGFLPDVDLALVEDFNFDGNQDIATLTMINDGNEHHEVLLYDPATKLFVRNQGLSELTSIQIVPGKKEIKSYHRGLVGKNSFDEAYYRVDQPGNRLVSIRDIRQELNRDKKSYTRVERVLKGDRMVEVSRKQIPGKP